MEVIIMKMSQMLGMRYKETPSDCQLTSHIFSIKGGYIKNVSSGVFSLYHPMKRITRKVEKIIRDEMDKIGGQEVLFPVVMPASIWEESGRYHTIGSEMVRFNDRSGSPLVLGMTHEEAAVHMAKNVATSYQHFPFMIYQIQTKFRDEPRCRGGLIRVREFTMKDAYSFHTNTEDLNNYYQECLKAYHNIFQRAGIPEVVAVAADSGMMGGSISHEFMFLSEVGEDTIVSCTNCDYLANMEATEHIVKNEAVAVEELEKISTPNTKTIEDLCAFLKIEAHQTAKAVIYQKKSDDQYVIVFVRGDFEVNETKLRNYLKEEVYPAVEIDPKSGIVAGFVGPLNLPSTCTIVYDKSLQGCESVACGANEVDFHYKGCNLQREMSNVVFVDVAKAVEGGICPHCGGSTLSISKGVEVGNIFQLGTKYTESMNMQYTDQQGESHFPIMGCYGVGVGRLVASVCEAKHDQYGPIWPVSIAPWQVQLCALRVGDEKVRETADLVYKALQDKGIEVLFDDRDTSAGSMFSDADLMGCPIRIIVSPKTCSRDAVELTDRCKTFRKDVAFSADDLESLVKEVQTAIEEAN